MYVNFIPNASAWSCTALEESCPGSSSSGRLQIIVLNPWAAASRTSSRVSWPDTENSGEICLNGMAKSYDFGGMGLP